MYEDGATAAAIALELGLHRRIVGKWIRLEALPERNRMTPKDSTPSRFHSFLECRWAEGFRNVRGLLREVQVLGYTGCYSRLAAFLSAWRKPTKAKNPSSEIPAKRRDDAVRPKQRERDLTDHRHRPVSATAAAINTAPARDSRSPQEGVARFRSDAGSRNAIQRAAPRR